ncbi:spermidine synthase [Schaalia naturae]|uniref:Spermidine synthase n=2 Tax=Schaalia naturae TaxID=635203 RepID=A0ABW2SL37_9ACTO
MTTRQGRGRGRDAHRDDAAEAQRTVDSGTASLWWDGPRATLFLDGVESSCVDVDHPGQLEFEYMQQMTQALSAWLPEPAPVRALHLGAAACALPWAWDVRRPGSRQVAVEVDAALAVAVREWFPLPRSPRLRIRVGDGRGVLEAAREGSCDVVVRDAFDHGRVPGSLLTAGAVRAAARALRPGGLYLANAVHGGPRDARPDVAAVCSVLPGACAVWDPKVGRAARQGNVVIVAQKPDPSWEPGAGAHPDPGRAGPPRMDPEELDRLLRRLPLPARAVRGPALERWLAGARPREDAPTGPGPGLTPPGLPGAG